jgi:NlpC/P60 family putative phage cell wall peptidase
MDEQAQRSLVAAEAMSWLGTPYHHHARIKGVGVDCAQILCAVYEACGVVGHIAPGQYPTDWHMHRNEEVYADWCARYAKRTDTAQAGDVALFRFGRCFSHGGIFVAPEMVVHAYINRGVNLTRLSEEPLCGRPLQIWSPWA